MPDPGGLFDGGFGDHERSLPAALPANCSVKGHFAQKCAIPKAVATSTDDTPSYYVQSSRRRGDVSNRSASSADREPIAAHRSWDPGWHSPVPVHACPIAEWIS